MLMDLLCERGAIVEYYDPYVPVIKSTREHSQFAGRKYVEWSRATIENFDLVLVATNHSSVNYHELGEWARCIVDTRNAMAPVKGVSGKVWKSRRHLANSFPQSLRNRIALAAQLSGHKRYQTRETNSSGAPKPCSIAW